MIRMTIVVLMIVSARPVLAIEPLDLDGMTGYEIGVLKSEKGPARFFGRVPDYFRAIKAIGFACEAGELANRGNSISIFCSGPSGTEVDYEAWDYKGVNLVIQRVRVNGKLEAPMAHLQRMAAVVGLNVLRP